MGFYTVLYVARLLDRSVEVIHSAATNGVWLTKQRAEELKIPEERIIERDEGTDRVKVMVGTIVQGGGKLNHKTFTDMDIRILRSRQKPGRPQHLRPSKTAAIRRRYGRRKKTDGNGDGDSSGGTTGSEGSSEPASERVGQPM